MGSPLRALKIIGPRRALNIAWRFALARATEASMPLAVSLEITSMCNLSCAYCGRQEPDRELSTAEVIRLIDELYRAGMLRLGITGGEATLRPDLGQVINHAVDLGVFTSLFSNGLHVARRLEELSRIHLYNTSLDGGRQAHDKNRGEGAWERAVEAIRAVRARGIPVLTYTVIHRESLEELDGILRLARLEGFACVFSPMVNHARMRDDARVDAALSDEIRGAFRRLLELKRGGAPVANSGVYLQAVADGQWEGGTRCRAGQFFCAVGPGGEMAPCGLLLGSDQVVDCRSAGFDGGFHQLQPGQCESGQCFTGPEMSYLLNLDAGALGNLLRGLGRHLMGAGA